MRLSGITPIQAKNLTYVGVPTAAELLVRSASPAGRKRLARLAAVDEVLLDSWITAARAMDPS